MIDLRSVACFMLVGLGGMLEAQSAKTVEPPKTAAEFPALKGDYLGQRTPGDTPVVFAPGIISNPTSVEHGFPAFSPDGNEVFWQANSLDQEKVQGLSMRRIGGQWTAPKVSPPFGGPVFSPDGKRLYFLPIGAENGETKGPHLVEKVGNEWGEPRCLNLLTHFPELKFVYHVSITHKGTLYFLGHAPGRGLKNDMGIYRLESVNGAFSKPELLPPSINAPGGAINWTPFIAPDESYLLFSSNRTDGQQNLFLCFRQAEGKWTEAIDLGEPINTKRDERYPAVSPDGKYLFFTRWVSEDNEDVFWVSAGILDKLKAKALQGGRLKPPGIMEEIHMAVDEGDLAKVQTLLKVHPEWLDSRDKEQRPPLIRACLNRQTMLRKVEIARFLIEKGADVHVTDNWLQTPLIAASVGYGPDYDLIQLLLAKGADVNRAGKNGITPLHWAAHYGDLKVAKLLLGHGADVNVSDTFKGEISTSSIHGSVLQVALRGGAKNLELVRLILNNGAKLNRRDVQGNTELYLVAMSGSAELARLLIQHGADVHAKNANQHTALYYAAKHGFRSVAEVLIAAGADRKAIVETNYGKAPELTKSLASGEAYIWPLGSLGAYAVKTNSTLLVFTIEDVIHSDTEAGLANGNLHPGELAGQNITMLLNHRERWQMGAGSFTALATLTPDVQVVSSFQPDLRDVKSSAIPSFRFAAPRKSFSMNGVQVHVIPATGGGVGYLVEADGLKIFHAGLHVSENTPESLATFRKEIDFLKPWGPIDIVMLTVHSHSNRIRAAFEPYLYLIDQLAPKAIYLSGANPGTGQQYVACAHVLRERNLPVLYPEKGGGQGDRSHYQKGRGFTRGIPSDGVDRAGVGFSAVRPRSHPGALCPRLGRDW